MKYSGAFGCLVALALTGCTAAAENPATIAELEGKDDLLSISQGAVLLSASSQYDDVSLDAFHLFDDCAWTKWNSASGKALNNAFDVELKNASSIEDIFINNERSRDFGAPGIQAKTIRVLASATSPDSGYEQLAEVVVNKEASKRITFDPKTRERTYKWLRFIVVDNWGYKDATELYEIQAYGSPVAVSAGSDTPRFDGGVYSGTWGPLKLVTEGNVIFGCACKPDKSDLDMLGSVRGNQARVSIHLAGSPGVAIFTQSASGEVLNISRYYQFQGKGTTSNLFAMQRREESPSCNREPIKSVEELIWKHLERYHKAVLYGIDFTPDSAELTSESDTVLNALVSLMTKQPNLRLSVEAHNGWTDSNPVKNIALDYHDDSIESHKKLSEDRAHAVVDWLCNHNVERSRLQARGWGKEKPVHLDGVETPRQSIILNRRIEIIPLSDAQTVSTEPKEETAGQHKQEQSH